jgi:hypothetical protein
MTNAVNAKAESAQITCKMTTADIRTSKSIKLNT